MNIVISGTVGVGKSTISSKLTKYLEEKNIPVKLFEEINESDPFIEKYYENRPEWSFLIQINFVLDRFKKAYNYDGKENEITIFDRHFLDDYIFANMKSILDDMTFLHWRAYEALNQELSALLKGKKDVEYFFLLKADFDKVLERISKRNRQAEKDVDVAYWKDLYYQYYESEKIREYITSNVKNLVIIDANSNDVDSIVEEIASYIK